MLWIVGLEVNFPGRVYGRQGVVELTGVDERSGVGRKWLPGASVELHLLGGRFAVNDLFETPPDGILGRLLSSGAEPQVVVLIGISLGTAASTSSQTSSPTLHDLGVPLPSPGSIVVGGCSSFCIGYRSIAGRR